MVSSEEVYSVGVFDFEAEEESDGLNRVVASVHEVSNHDELVGRNASPLRKEVLHIVELSVDISSDVDWRVNCDDVGLIS